MEICRLCFIQTTEHCKIHLGQPSIENKITTCIPELKTGSTLNPVICVCCLKLLNASYEFHIKCLKNEELITSYLHKNGEVDLVDLKLLIEDYLCEEKKLIEASKNKVVKKVEVPVQKPESENNAEYEEINDVENSSPFKNSDDSIVSDEEVITIYCDGFEKNDIQTEQEKNNIQKSDIPIECKNCSKQFQTKTELKKHSKLEHGLEKLHCCIICNSSFPTHCQLENHMPLHCGKPEHQCTVCGKCFYFKRSLNKHILRHKVVHKYKEKKIQCTECGKCFPSISQLNLHLRSHTGERPFVCEVCNKGFAAKTSLIRHKLLHTGERPHVCDICNKTFNDRSTLAKHAQTHKGEKKHFCQFCNMGFYHFAPLKLHLRKHTGEKPLSCNICGKTFGISTGLKLHLRIHTGDKPYQCEICSKCFTSKSGLNRHAKFHSGEKPHICDICARPFTLKSGLKNHIQCCHEEHKVKKRKKDKPNL